MSATLNLENLGTIDHNQAKAIIDSAISLAVTDLDKFGTDEKSRKVCIEIEMWYDTDKDEKRLSVKAQARLPARATNEARGRTKAEGPKARFLFDDIKPLDDEEDDVADKNDKDKKNGGDQFPPIK